MEIYLVGGAVRDALLDYPAEERDWVVVGSNPQQLLDAGYQQVGKDFPVFLHPETKEEYALARTERKRGHGYTGFEVHCADDVTLEQDLKRRDLTINAMARADDNTLIDPYGGQRDLENRILRHVSAAFAEDPLRVLRTARFAARYAHLGFIIAKDTIALMADIVDQGELEHLSSERIWSEIEKALGERHPERFIEALRECGALAALLPEVDQLFGVPQRKDYHPEIDTGVHTLMCLQQSALLASSPAVRFAVLLHDLGKGITPQEMLPRHIGHEKRGKPLVLQVCERLRAPNYFRELALKVCEFHLLCHKSRELRGKTLLKLLTETGGFRQSEMFEDFLTACEADARGRLGLEQRPYPQADYLRRARSLASAVSAQELQSQGLEGKALGDAIHRQRIRQLDQLRAGQST